jgi:peptidoglycan/xylan/chitin deacetylase (PgdA/CDA1 family)
MATTQFESAATALCAGFSPVNILMYHNIEAQPRPPRYNHFYVLRDQFRKQMTGLLAAGYRACTLADVGAALEGRGRVPEKPFVVTFDDGYANLLRYVHPVMMELDIPYCVYLVSGLVGGVSDWVASEGFETSKLLTWSEIREMQAWKGVTFQSHTVTHPRLADMELDAAVEELKVSKTELEQRLGHEVDQICYPYGSVSAPVADAAREMGYRLGLTTSFGRARPGEDPLLLPRVSIHHVPPFSLKFGPRGANFWWRIRTRKDTRLSLDPSRAGAAR